MGSFSYGYMMSQIVGGFLADKFGGAIVMVYCGVVWSLLTYLTPTLVRQVLYFPGELINLHLTCFSSV